MLISKSLKITESGLNMINPRSLFIQINLKGINFHLRGIDKDKIVNQEEDNTQEKDSIQEKEGIINMEITGERMKSIIKEDVCFLA